MSDGVRVGVVGAGAIAQVAHLVVLGKLEGVEVVGICDTDVPKAQALAGRFGVPDVYDDIEDLISYAKPDAVVICAPDHLDEVHTISAVSAGITVLCVRPLTLTPAGVERAMTAMRGVILRRRTSKINSSCTAPSMPSSARRTRAAT